MGWVISWANEWEDYSNYFGDRAGISRNWATTQFLAFVAGLRTVVVLVGVPLSMLVYYNEPIVSLKVHWKVNLPSSWT